MNGRVDRVRIWHDGGDLAKVGGCIGARLHQQCDFQQSGRWDKLASNKKEVERAYESPPTCNFLLVTSERTASLWEPAMQSPSIHLYVDVLHLDESTYNVEERHVPINLAFHAYLQEHKGMNKSQFLALWKSSPLRGRDSNHCWISQNLKYSLCCLQARMQGGASIEIGLQS